MKYENAQNVLPGELLAAVQAHYQGGYLYIPKTGDSAVRQKTEYRTELDKRNQHIYLKHLEGRTNRQLGRIFHLSESSVRRIVAKERVQYQNMKEMIKNALPLWGIQGGQVTQIYPSAWEINHTYVLKVYSDKNQLERNIKLATLLRAGGIPAAPIQAAHNGGNYAAVGEHYFLLTEKLPGENSFDSRDTQMAWKMGRAVAQLHRALLSCEKELNVWDNSLLEEMKGWVYSSLAQNGWQLIREAEYDATVRQLECVYAKLPVQLIHRDVHSGNFLFQDGKFTGYIDFDLSQRNIRIFDIGYYLAGLLAEETDRPLGETQWLANVHAVIAGYESVSELSAAEKGALVCVMECIEILFAAYFAGQEDIRQAEDACRVFHLIHNWGRKQTFRSWNRHYSGE